MRHSILTLWLATLFSFFLPAFACKQRFFSYQIAYEDCNEGLAIGVKQRLEKECATFATKYQSYNNEVNGALGRDIDSKVNAWTSGNDVSSCITYECQVRAWRFREWQPEFDDKPVPTFQDWTYKESDSKWGKKVDC